MNPDDLDVTRTNAEPRLSRAYWRSWWATGISNIGDGAFTAAVPLLAVTITHDPRLVSVVAAATYLPWLLLSLQAGALIDRRDPVGLMWRSQAIQAAIVGVVALLVVFGHVDIFVLACAGFGLGACEVVFSIASQAILPEIVAKSLLHRANGNQQTAVAVGKQFLGPPLGSLLFAVAAALPFGMNAATFVVSAVLLSTLPRRRRPVVEHRSIAAGLRWLARHRLLRTLALLLGANTFCGQVGNVALILLATQTLRVDTAGYGLLLASAAIGSVLGGLINARIVEKIGALPALLCALATNVVVFVGIGLSPNGFVLGTMLAVNGFVVTLWNIVAVSLRQEIVPTELFGRVSSVYKMVGWGLIPLGALTGGLVAHLLGLRAPYLVAGGLRGIALLLAIPALLHAMRDQPRHTSDRNSDSPEPK
ncbi:MFS transporter [Nocardia sp. NPDC051052]|uniref:MFS transporter n=1 Tax=Nocardia sp. NPDC051052 TaxID=3364322 RepID=UPI0037AF8577